MFFSLSLAEVFSELTCSSTKKTMLSGPQWSVSFSDKNNLDAEKLDENLIKMSQFS